MGGTTPYYKKILNVFSSSIVAYYPLWEESGTTAYDISGNARNAAYGGVTVNTISSPTGKSGVSFDGSNDYINMYSAGLVNAINYQEGSISFGVKMSSGDVWADGETRRILNLIALNDNEIGIVKDPIANRIVATYKANNITESLIVDSVVYTDWFSVILTWSLSNDRVRLYINKTLSANSSTLGTFTGPSISTATLAGNYSTSSPTQSWSGYMSDILIVNKEMTQAEVDICANPFV